MSRILIVEDNDALLERIAARVRERGHEAVDVDHFEDAIDALDRDRANGDLAERFEVVVVDLARDETIGSGEDWGPGLSVIKKASLDKYLQIVVYTALPEGQAAAAVSPYRLFRYILKDTSIVSLVDVIEEGISERGRFVKAREMIEEVRVDVGRLEQGAAFEQSVNTIQERLFELEMRVIDLISNRGD